MKNLFLAILLLATGNSLFAQSAPTSVSQLEALASLIEGKIEVTFTVDPSLGRNRISNALTHNQKSIILWELSQKGYEVKAGFFDLRNECYIAKCCTSVLSFEKNGKAIAAVFTLDPSDQSRVQVTYCEYTE